MRDGRELVDQAKIEMPLVQVAVPVVSGAVPGQVHLAPFAIDLEGVPGVVVVLRASVGNAHGVEQLGVDALVALAGAQTALGRAPVQAVVVVQLVDGPVVQPHRHGVFGAVGLLAALRTALLTICVTEGRVGSSTAVVRR